ncbi:BTAD domain-containing putative transcriptional regulator [Angustibacter luteus]|uniref:BTAD domain-containing putative transcriptional regulator n=1 Tax=Angustibacter luteus TaxID=658456 RepID=A0ABW1JBY5_9ACTN
MPELAYRLLGGLEVASPAGRLDVGPRKQQALLAVLLLQSGRTLSLDGLVGAVWGADAPERAEASVHSYISTLRRALEPDRKPREPASVLVTRGQGYALVAARDQVDAWRFEDAVAAARTCSAAGDLDGAARLVAGALGDYAPLLPDFEDDEWSRPDRIRLERVHAAAVRLSYDVRLGRGEHRALEPELRAALDRDPLDEEVAALLAVALYRSDRQREALQVLADCKRALGDQLGVDPGPRLRQLELDLLSHADHLAVPTSEPTPVPTAAQPAGHRSPPGSPALVGRDAELATLTDLVSSAADGGRVAVVEAEAGGGKTALLDALAAAVHEQADVVWGRCAQGPGTPTLWPWSQVVDVLTGGAPGSTVLAALLPGRPGESPEPSAAFRQAGDLVSLLGDRVRRRPLVLVLDDLHWADEASTALLAQVATRLPAGVTLCCALRPPGQHAPAHLVAALAALARVPGQARVDLPALGPDEVAALLAVELGTSPAGGTVQAVLARSGGNPFFVRELARVVQARAEGEDVVVPASVRDVVRTRLAALPEPTVVLLRLAAVLGRDVDLTVLAAANGSTLDELLEGISPAVDDGVLVPHPTRVGIWRFSHDLVRDAVVDGAGALMLPRLHLRVADALSPGRAPEGPGQPDAEAAPPLAAEALAHHLWSAGPLAEPRRTASALLAAAHAALAKHAYAAATRHLELAIGVSSSAGLDDLELDGIALLTTIVGVQAGYIGTDDALLARGEELAERLGRVRTGVELVYARWGAASQRVELDRSAELIARLEERASGSADPVVRLYALHARGIDRWDRGEIGESRVALDSAADLLAELDEGEQRPVLAYDVRLLSPAFRSLVHTLTDDLDSAHAIQQRMRTQVQGDPYGTVVWAQFTANAASLEGDVERTLAACATGLAADPDGAFAFLGTMLRSEQAWARGMHGTPDDAREALAEVARLDEVLLEMGARTGEHGTLLIRAYLHLASGEPTQALAALDEAAASADRYQQRPNEALASVVRARAQLALGVPAVDVHATLAEGRRLAQRTGALLFARRADELADQLHALGSGAAEA